MLTEKEITTLNEQLHTSSSSIVEKNTFILSLLKLELEELYQLVKENILVIGFTIDLGHYLSESECLRDLLDVMANQKLRRGTGYPNYNLACLFKFNGESIFFRLRDNELILGFYHEIKSVIRNESYPFYGLDPV